MYTIEKANGFDFDTVVCGGGPAGLGPLVAAAARGQIQRVLDLGVLVVEQSARLGGGAIGGYRLRGNSLAGAFLESLASGADAGFFDALRGARPTRALRDIAGTPPPLSLVGEYLTALGGAIEGALDASAASAAAPRTRVAYVRLLPAGGVGVGVEPAGRPAHEVTARRALLTLGGRPPARMLQTEISPGLSLRGYAGKVVHSSAIVEGRHEGAAACLRSDRDLRVAVIGGAHSAWSAAWSLTRRATGRPTVQVLHRRPTRLFYMSVEEAREDGYDFDPGADVCPLSGRVHRFSGLRGDARDLAREVLGHAAPGRQADTVSCLSLLAGEEVGAALERADLVVSATGYDARLPELLTAGGEPLHLLRREVGLAVSAEAEVLDADGRPIPELLAYGLGAGLAPSVTVGGEPSASTRADGVWLYHHDVGGVVLDRILQRDAEGLADVR
ncbi:MAG TPA: hypothetical protein VD741_07890 [Solirubrobacterales bacterium]|nr:hypothetical protein [Solirubrobacterales bacterium]